MKTSLRDQIAIAAMQGMLSNSALYGEYQKKQFAELSYAMADALLEQRKKSKPSKK